jgi:hypothetical protein
MLVALAIAFTSAEAAAQRKVRPNLILGMASSTLVSDTDDAEVDRRTGVSIGATIDVPIGTNADFITGLQWVQKGASVSEQDVNFELELQLAYLQIPALLRMDFGSQGVRPFLEGGAALGIRLSCDAVVKGGGFNVSAACDEFQDPDTGETVEDPVKSTDFSVIIGGGVDFGRARIGLRYDHGLSNISNLDTEESIKNRSFVIYTAIRLTR